MPRSRRSPGWRSIPRSSSPPTLAAAGLWQFSPLRDRCLDACRSPLGFVMNRWVGADERRESLAMGIAHGAFCVGCCWSLMLVMFGWGFGSFTAMLALGALTAIEKNMPAGRRLTRPLGVVAHPRGGLRGRRVNRRVVCSWHGRSHDAAHADPSRAPRPRHCRDAGRASSMPRGRASSRMATPASRPVASRDAAGVPLSQIHYHFGSKQALILAVLDGGERAAPGAAADDVRGLGAALAAVGTCLRLPGRGPRVRATSGSSRR